MGREIDEIYKNCYCFKGWINMSSDFFIDNANLLAPTCQTVFGVDRYLFIVNDFN